MGRKKAAASSSAAARGFAGAEFGEQGGGGFGGGGFGNAAVQLASTSSDVSPTLATALKQLSKKDGTTKLKALADVERALGADDGKAQAVAALPLFSYAYCKLATDHAWRVRQTAHKVMGLFGSLAKKELAPHLKTVVGEWWCGQFDSRADVSRAASAAFGLTFAPKRQLEVLKHCRNSLMEALQAKLRTTVQSLVAPSRVTVEEAQFIYENVLFSALLGLRVLLERLGEAGEAAQLEEQLGSLADGAFFKLAANASPVVRSAFYALVPCLCEHARPLAEASLPKLAPAVLGALSEQTANNYAALWAAVLQLLRAFPGAWEHAALRKSVLPKMWSCLRAGSYGAGGTTYPSLLPWLAALPEPVHEPRGVFMAAMFESLWAGLGAAQLGEAQGQLVSSWMDCARWALAHGGEVVAADDPLLETCLLQPLRMAMRGERLAGGDAEREELLLQQIGAELQHLDGTKLAGALEVAWGALGGGVQESIPLLATDESGEAAQCVGRFCQLLAGYLRGERGVCPPVVETVARAVLDQSACPAAESLLVVEQLCGAAGFRSLKASPADDFSRWLGQIVESPETGEAALRDLTRLLLVHLRELEPADVARQWDAYVRVVSPSRSLLQQLLTEVGAEFEAPISAALVELFVECRPKAVEDAETSKLVAACLCRNFGGAPFVDAQSVQEAMSWVSDAFGKCGFEVRGSRLRRICAVAEACLQCASLDAGCALQQTRLLLQLFKLQPGAACVSQENSAEVVAPPPGVVEFCEAQWGATKQRLITAVSLGAFDAHASELCQSVVLYLDRSALTGENFARSIALAEDVLSMARLSDDRISDDAAAKVVQQLVPLDTLVRLRAARWAGSFAKEDSAKACWLLYFGMVVLQRAGIGCWFSSPQAQPLLAADRFLLELMLCGTSSLESDVTTDIKETGKPESEHHGGSMPAFPSAALDDIRAFCAEELQPHWRQQRSTLGCAAWLERALHLATGTSSRYADLFPVLLPASVSLSNVQDLQDLQGAAFDPAVARILAAADPDEALVAGQLVATCYHTVAAGNSFVLRHATSQLREPEGSLPPVDCARLLLIGECAAAADAADESAPEGSLLSAYYELVTKYLAQPAADGKWDLVLRRAMTCLLSVVISHVSVSRGVSDDSVQWWAMVSKHLSTTTRSASSVSPRLHCLSVRCAAAALARLGAVAKAGAMSAAELEDVEDTLMAPVYDQLVLTDARWSRDAWGALASAVGGWSGAHRSVMLKMADDLPVLLHSHIPAVQRAVYTLLARLSSHATSEWAPEEAPDDHQCVEVALKVERPSLFPDSLWDIAEGPVPKPGSPKVRGFLSVWSVILGSLSTSPKELRPRIVAYLLEANSLSVLLKCVQVLLPLRKGSAASPAKAGATAGMLPQLAIFEAEGSDLTQCLVAVYCSVLRQLPALARAWFSGLPRGVYAEIERYTSACISPTLVAGEMSSLSRAAKSMDGLSVRVSTVARQVTAGYNCDDVTLEVVITLAESHPLRTCSIGSNGVHGMGETKWRRVIMQITTLLSNRDGTVLDGVLLWKENLDKQFAGIEPCPICYSIIHMVTHTAPRLHCSTCRNGFHNECLYKWFQTSHNSTCPMCKQPWV